MSIGGRFLEVRKARGLKQTDVAEAIGISHGAVVNYEKGRDPPANVIIAFSKAFNVNPMWLLMGIGRADQSSTDDLYGRSIEIAWTYLARGGDEVAKADLVKLGSALFQYLMEHGDISEAMAEKLLSLSA